MALDENRANAKFLAVDDMRPLASKVLIPATLISGGIFLSIAPTTRPTGIVLCGFIVLLGFVQFIVVGLAKPTEECLYYRRFVEWRRIEYSDIVKCGRPIFPLFWGLHYLRLRSFELPLGKLYFVQYHPARPLSQHELDHEMVEYIKTRVAGGAIPSSISLGPENAGLATPPELPGIKACAITAILSMLMVLFLRVLLSWPGQGLPPKIGPGQGFGFRALAYLSIFCAHLVDWPYNLVAILSLLVGILLLRFRGWAVFLSLTLGAILGGIVARWWV